MFVGDIPLVYFQPMGRISVLSLLVLLSTGAGALAQKEKTAPPSVSCLGPEGEGYLRELLTRIHELEHELDSEKQAHIAERERSERRCQARGVDLSDRVPALKTELEEANEARRKAEEEAAAAKAAAARETKAREEAQERIAELERPAVAKPSPLPAAESEAPLRSGASDTGPRARTEGTPSAKLSDRELAAAQLAALRGEPPLPASSPPPPATGEAPQGERILPGEQLTLRVANIDELNRTVEVRDDGSIDLPLLGAVQAAGRTESQLVADLRERLSAYLKSPRVEVSRVR
jgi:hypothetical protein